MKRFFYFIFVFLLFSCGRSGKEPGTKIITVSIAPFKYFVEEIGGGNFQVNVMVPAGANPHIYEPFPDQINQLRASVAYISNGFLGFEMTWLDRFYEMNRNMKKLSLGDKIDHIEAEHHHEGDEHAEGADPHYWVSPVCAMSVSSQIKELLVELDPEKRQVFEKNYKVLTEKIRGVDSLAREAFTSSPKKAFMIYHPNLAYLARDYGLEEISVEHEGKEPSPSRLRELIDRARKDSLKVILVQREYDTKNAQTIASETGARVVIIDPLSGEWLSSTTELINTLKNSFNESLK